MLFHIWCFHLWHFKQTSYWVSLETQTGPPFFMQCVIFQDQDCHIQTWQHACKCTFTYKLKKFLHLWYTLQYATFFCQHAYTKCTVTQYINITIETIVSNIDMDRSNNLRAQELMCLLTFQSNDNFILS